MRMIVIMLMLVSSLSTLTNSVFAQSSRTFPYDAVVADDEVYARSGPGKQYYPTSRFRKGDPISVVRHDPGRWFMIEPPLGSFSWVRTEFVRRDGDQGTIISDAPVIAWVGTSFGDDHFVEQRRLQKGEEVEIVGEKTLKDDRGEVAYLKIKPPKGHYRWVPGAKIVSADKTKQLAQSKRPGGDPFSDDSHSTGAVRDPNVSQVDLAELEAIKDSARADVGADVTGDDVPLPKDVASKAPVSKSRDKIDTDTESPFGSTKAKVSSTKDKSGAADRQKQLASIDQQLQEITQRESKDWDFGNIEQELLELQKHNDSADAASRRLALLAKYNKTKSVYDEVAQIMEQTNRRDAELAAAQRAGQQFVPPTVVPEGQPQPTTQPINVNRGPVPVPNSSVSPVQPNRVPAPTIRTRPTGPTPQPASPNRQPLPQNSPVRNRFGGAGIIQRSSANIPNAPKHVLVHPNGRVLAFLQSDGVDLDKYVNESMGLEGERTFRPDLQSDLMIVRGAQPVKLKP